MFSGFSADIVYKGNEYELTDSVMVSMECIGAVALYLLWERSVVMGIGTVQNRYEDYEMSLGVKKRKHVAEKEAKGASGDKTAECMTFLRGKSEEILEKLRNGETETAYPIGGEAYTEKEWDKLLQKFDDIQEDVRRKMEERIRKLEEKEAEKKVAEGSL